MYTTINKLKSLITVLAIGLFALSAKAQSVSQKYNEGLRITEYYDATGQMTHFSRYNKRSNTIDFYDLSGKKMRSEPAKVDSTRVEVKKNTYPKAELSPQELSTVQHWRYEEIEGQRLIRQSDADLETIGYYNLQGKLVGLKLYNRPTETWSFEWLVENELKK